MKVAVIFLLAVFFPTQAFAYFDPGTGSMLIQITVGMLAGVAVFWRKIKKIISSWFNLRKSKDDQPDGEQ